MSDLIDLFKIRTGRFISHDSEINLREVVQELFDIFMIQTKEKGIEMKIRCSENIPQNMKLDTLRFK